MAGRIILGLTLAFCSCGCTIESTVPLGEPEKEKPDERLYGKWSCPLPKALLVLTRCEEKLIEAGVPKSFMRIKCISEKETSSSVAFCAKVGGRDFLNVIARDDVLEVWKAVQRGEALPE